MVYCLANAVPKHGIAAYLRIAKAFTYFLYFTLAANVLGTRKPAQSLTSFRPDRSPVLIAGRIFWVRRQSVGSRSGTDAVTHIVTLIVESGTRAHTKGQTRSY